MRYFPIFLDLRQKICVVVGGGRVAERKVLNLLKAGALVTVISPEITPSLRRLEEKGKIKHRSRPFRTGDLKSAHLVIAATDNRQTNERVFRVASSLRIPVNVVDDPSHCSFIVPAIISRGDILLAISTGGQSPALAKALREKLQREIGPEYTFLLKILGAVRKKILPLGWEPIKNQKIFRLLLRADLLLMIRQRNFSALEARVEKIIGSKFPLKDLGLK
jgi:precorrin-2 dehydrogenase/sirohydrochlorin ferrochelatase